MAHCKLKLTSQAESLKSLYCFAMDQETLSGKTQHYYIYDQQDKNFFTPGINSNYVPGSLESLTEEANKLKQKGYVILNEVPGFLNKDGLLRKLTSNEFSRIQDSNIQKLKLTQD